ncbi:hypothetical protein M8J77_009098 [Diaphorina citri]|nr:hypothetical protein M8J77_009098 [Diaphorina citri]
MKGKKKAQPRLSQGSSELKGTALGALGGLTDAPRRENLQEARRRLSQGSPELKGTGTWSTGRPDRRTQERSCLN